jgi:dTDP-6-deoxy-L-talose 4-dehydrogenase (NAD+)
MKILVTGANGFIGSRVVTELLKLGVTVIATDISNSHIDSRANFIKADIFSQNDNWFDFFGKPDCCLHMAWRDGFVHNSPKQMGDLSAHFNFLFNLISHGLPQLAAMGTMHEVGYYVGSIDENTPCKPLSQYGIAKNALGESMRIVCQEHGCIFQWLRAFYIYSDDKSGNSIFGKIMKADSEGQKLFPFTTGENEYDFISVDDLAKLISLTVTQKEVNGIINVCSGKPVSLRDEMEWYIKSRGLNIKLDYGKFPERTYDSPCVYGDNSKIRKILAAHVRNLVV